MKCMYSGIDIEPGDEVYETKDGNLILGDHINDAVSDNPGYFGLEKYIYEEAKNAEAL